VENLKKTTWQATKQGQGQSETIKQTSELRHLHQ